ncbi:MAG: sulfatase [Verrucomicrobiales bacterium]|nr:sulfatase [Verrucomicrobiales bacterium]
MKVWICFTVFLSALLAGVSPAAERPNILFIFCDDHATQAISAYDGPLAGLAPTPNIDKIAEQGMLFRRCYVTNSICGPSRAVVLTGKYSHLNGFRNNGDTFDGSQETAPKLLGRAGYETAIVGKWHLKSEPTGFDHYEVLKGQGQYYNPRLLTNGKMVNHEGYTTDIITDQTLKWLEQRDRDKPFFLMSQHKAPHGRWEPAFRHLDFLEDVDVPEPPTLFDDYSGRSKAASMHEMGIADHMGDHRLMLEYSSKFTPEQFKKFDGFFRPKNEAFLAAKLEGRDLTRWHYQRYIKNYLRCVKAVDENVGRLLGYLEDHGLAENTIVIYSSDQGFYLGEHGWFDKRWMYEESFRTPLLVRWPGVVKENVENDTDLVSNLDFLPTFLEAVGAPVPEEIQGRSLVPILKGDTPDGWRKTHYYHYYESGGHGVPLHFGVTDGRYKLIRFPEKEIDDWELFDIQADPLELESRYGDSTLEEVQRSLKKELTRLRGQYELPEGELD